MKLNFVLPLLLLPSPSVEVLRVSGRMKVCSISRWTEKRGSGVFRTLQTTKNVLKSKRNERVIKGNLGQCLFYSEKRYNYYMNKKSRSLLIKKILM